MEQPFERGITCSVGSIDHEATTSISGGGSHELFKIFKGELLPISQYSPEDLKFSHKGEIGFLKDMRIVVEEKFFS